MDLLVATLCDAAADYHGKLCVLGTFDTIVTAELPVAPPQCALALRFIFRKGEEGDHQLGVRIVDEDGHAIVPPIDARLPIEIPEEVFFLSRNVVLNFQRLTLKNEGLYSLDISLDDRQLLSVPLQVRVLKKKES